MDSYIRQWWNQACREEIERRDIVLDADTKGAEMDYPDGAELRRDRLVNQIAERLAKVHGGDVDAEVLRNGVLDAVAAYRRDPRSMAASRGEPDADEQIRAAWAEHLKFPELEMRRRVGGRSPRL
jgi:hypothetical protein